MPPLLLLRSPNAVRIPLSRHFSQAFLREPPQRNVKMGGRAQSRNSLTPSSSSSFFSSSGVELSNETLRDDHNLSAVPYVRTEEERARKPTPNQTKPEAEKDRAGVRSKGPKACVEVSKYSTSSKL